MANSSSTVGPKTYVLAYFALWGTVLVSLQKFESFEITEALAALAILGVIFPALALLTTRRVDPLPDVVREPKRETLFLVIYLGVIAWVLVSVFGRIARITTEPLHLLMLLGVKLIVFVVFPATIILALGHYRLSEFIPISLTWRNLRPALWMSLAALVMQSLLGRGLHDIREAHMPVWLLAVATLLSFVWLMIEVGVVEEFFFRVLLQERLATVLRSPWGGLFMGALLFGLVHAPGFYLRSATSQEALSAHPSLFMAIGYSIVMTSLAGLFLGVLWMRTKNFAVVVIAHAATDLLPNLVPLVKAFRLTR
jgi:membrane protease YdiL (CAAX protease family)